VGGTGAYMGASGELLQTHNGFDTSAFTDGTGAAPNFWMRFDMLLPICSPTSGRLYSVAMTTLVFTAIGDDQAGLVDALSGVIADHGANWDESHMAHLAGKFAGIVQITVPDSRADALIGALQPLEQDGLLTITVTRANDQPAAEQSRAMALHLVGQDRRGIVHEVSHALAALGANIQELETSTSEAPMAGGLLFEAKARLAVPESVSADELRNVLEGLANELIVDIDLDLAAD
jgi:glycine cleavage system regulatory protein